MCVSTTTFPLISTSGLPSATGYMHHTSQAIYLSLVVQVLEIFSFNPVELLLALLAYYSSLSPLAPLCNTWSTSAFIFERMSFWIGAFLTAHLRSYHLVSLRHVIIQYKIFFSTTQHRRNDWNDVSFLIPSRHRNPFLSHIACGLLFFESVIEKDL